MPFKENSILKLRALEPEDLELLYKWENDPAIWVVSNTITPFSRYILKKYIENSHEDIFQSNQLRLMIELTNKHTTIGTIDLFDFDPFHLRAGIGIMIAEQYRRNNYADESLKILVEYAFKTLRLKQLYCNISENNEISLKLFRNNGFEIVGLKKDWNKTPTGWSNEYLLQRLTELEIN